MGKVRTEVAIKYGPEGYQSPAIKRFTESLPPNPEARSQTGRNPVGQRILAIAVLIALLLAGGGYLRMRASGTPPQQAPARIVAKDRQGTAPGTPVLGVEVRMPDGTRYSVVVQCDETTWARFKAGDHALVSYRPNPSTKSVEVVHVEPMPDPVDL